MSRPCSCCIHPDRLGIDSAIRSGVTLKEVANRYNISPMAVSRHKKHMDTQIESVVAVVKDAVVKNVPPQALEPEPLRKFLDVYVELLDHYEDMKNASLDAKASLDVGDRVKVGKEIRETIRDLAKLLGLVNADGVSVDLLKLQDRHEYFKRLVMSEVCPDCRERLLAKFEEYVRSTT